MVFFGFLDRGAILMINSKQVGIKDEIECPTPAGILMIFVFSTDLASVLLMFYVFISRFPLKTVTN